ncbi:MAG: ATP-grasp domain-containing protein [Candidatus Paceibacterota bacterium]
MFITDLRSLKDQFKEIETPIFGAGVYAFDRLGLESIADPYRILALRYSLDTELIEKDIEMISLEKGMGVKHIDRPRNATTVLGHQDTKKYLEKFKKLAIFVYKPSSKMEQMAEENGWTLIANSVNFGKKTLENKIEFRKILEQINVPATPGKTTTLHDINYDELVDQYGLPFVIQHPTRGGGKGTFFINQKIDLDEAIDKIDSRWDDKDERVKKPPEEVVISKYIDGPSPSVTGCITKYGILSTDLQHQVLDIPELYHPAKGSGLFCGHDWTASRFSEEINRQANEYTRKVGEYFKEQGYKGIFGLDFVLDSKQGQLYLTECNPRMVGAYPVLNMSQLLNDEPPLLAFHVLEFLNVDYEIDLDDINRQIRQEKTGAQMILHNLTQKWARNHYELKAGVYRLEGEKLRYLRPGYDLKHLEDKGEFILADGVPLKGSHFSPNRRICRILTLDQVLDDTNYKQLNPWAKKVTETVYQNFDIKPIKFVKLKKFFKPDLLAKG